MVGFPYIWDYFPVGLELARALRALQVWQAHTIPINRNFQDSVTFKVRNSRQENWGKRGSLDSAGRERRFHKGIFWPGSVKPVHGGFVGKYIPV